MAHPVEVGSYVIIQIFQVPWGPISVLLLGPDERDGECHNHSKPDQGFVRLEVLQLHGQLCLQLRELLCSTFNEVPIESTDIYVFLFQKDILVIYLIGLAFWISRHIKFGCINQL